MIDNVWNTIEAAAEGVSDSWDWLAEVATSVAEAWVRGHWAHARNP